MIVTVCGIPFINEKMEALLRWSPTAPSVGRASTGVFTASILVRRDGQPAPSTHHRLKSFMSMKTESFVIGRGMQFAKMNGGLPFTIKMVLRCNCGL